MNFPAVLSSFGLGAIVLMTGVGGSPMTPWLAAGVSGNQGARQRLRLERRLPCIPRVRTGPTKVIA